MPKYTPPPPSLDHLNPIQRYMQKGALDKQDYVWLALFVLAYFTARPYIQRLFKWWFAEKDVIEGERAHQEYMQSKAKISPNSIRGSESAEPTSLPDTTADATTSGSNVDKKGKVVNRKAKGPSTAEKAEEDKLLDWDEEPARRPVEGDKSDVMTWLEKWDE